MHETMYQYCQKIVVFRNNNTEVLLAQRTGEDDYDGTYSFIGGKLEWKDQTLQAGLQREKSEEIGDKCKVKASLAASFNQLFTKNNGTQMVLSHYYAQFISGDIVLGPEYINYKWVALEKLEKFSPKIENITVISTKLLTLKEVFLKDEFIIL